MPGLEALTGQVFPVIVQMGQATDSKERHSTTLNQGIDLQVVAKAPFSSFLTESWLILDSSKDLNSSEGMKR